MFQRLIKKMPGILAAGLAAVALLVAAPADNSQQGSGTQRPTVVQYDAGGTVGKAVNTWSPHDGVVHLKLRIVSWSWGG